MDIISELSTDAVSKLFFSQIRRMSIGSCRQKAVHAFSVRAPDESREAGLC